MKVVFNLWEAISRAAVEYQRATQARELVERAVDRHQEGDTTVGQQNGRDTSGARYSVHRGGSGPGDEIPSRRGTRNTKERVKRQQKAITAEQWMMVSQVSYASHVSSLQ
jgi:hypothetical protein